MADSGAIIRPYYLAYAGADGLEWHSLCLARRTAITCRLTGVRLGSSLEVDRVGDDSVHCRAALFNFWNRSRRTGRLFGLARAELGAGIHSGRTISAERRGASGAVLATRHRGPRRLFGGG